MQTFHTQNRRTTNCRLGHQTTTPAEKDYTSPASPAWTSGTEVRPELANRGTCANSERAPCFWHLYHVWRHMLTKTILTKFQQENSKSLDNGQFKSFGCPLLVAFMAYRKFMRGCTFLCRPELLPRSALPAPPSPPAMHHQQGTTFMNKQESTVSYIEVNKRDSY